MSVELRPLGVACNLGCQYCYQNAHRDAGNTDARYDIPAMQRAVLELGGPFHLFGGEPLLMPLDDLETLFAWGLDQFGENQVQTNGALITPAHVELFRRYRVRVGISMDGPDELNDVRWAGTLEQTRSATRASQQAIERLCATAMAPAVLLQITRCNASEQRLPRLLEWIRALDRLGVPAMRIHVLEIETRGVRDRYALSAADNNRILLQLMALERELTGLHFDLFDDIRALLRGDDAERPCVWRACDPYTTASVTGVGGDGSHHNCGLTDKEGINFQKPEHEGFERYLALYHTPQEHGGCRGCRFFLACKGQCPGTGLGHDWRNRSEYCEVWKSLFSHIERELLEQGEQPLSRHPQRVEWERRMLEGWAAGQNYSLSDDFGGLSG